MHSIAIDKIMNLDFWSSRVSPDPLSGGITNANFVVADAGKKYFVRVGDDIPLHGVMRFNELAASKAAHAAGISPEVIFNAPGVMVLQFIDGKTFTPADVRKPNNLTRIIELVRKCHHTIPDYLRGPALVFWPFQIVRDYANTLSDRKDHMTPELLRLLDIAQVLEKAVGAVDMVFGHNDLLPANFIDDGKRIWLVDWDYAGFGSPLFDLGGLASNNELSSAQETKLLENYFQKPIDDELRVRYEAMKCASLLRESMWSMVSEKYSEIDFDYMAYTQDNLARFEKAWAGFQMNSG
ncbi:MAG: phosphotransferase [Gammaproteobacteria bacterium]|nr:phosphotransferase [Gammaproteobacteria bacterium]